jgi:hypothetical protein
VASLTPIEVGVSRLTDLATFGIHVDNPGPYCHICGVHTRTYVGEDGKIYRHAEGIRADEKCNRCSSQHFSYPSYPHPYDARTLWAVNQRPTGQEYPPYSADAIVKIDGVFYFAQKLSGGYLSLHNLETGQLVRQTALRDPYDLLCYLSMVQDWERPIWGVDDGMIGLSKINKGHLVWINSLRSGAIMRKQGEGLRRLNVGDPAQEYLDHEMNAFTAGHRCPVTVAPLNFAASQYALSSAVPLALPW